MKKILLLLTVVFAVFAFSSCKKKEKTVKYTFEFSHFMSPNQLDYATLKDYFASKGFEYSKSYTGATQSDRDAQAISEFNTKISKVSYEEISKLDIHKSTEFVYQVSRPEGTSGKKVLASFEYPEQ